MAVNFAYKAIVFPAILVALSSLFPNLIAFEAWLPLLLVSALFIWIGVVADEIILPLFGNAKATGQGFLFMSGALWLAPYVLERMRSTAGGALLAGLCLSLAEFGMHRWLLQRRKA